MMAKITKGHGFGGVVRYVMQQEKDARLIDSKDVLADSQKSIINSFRLQSQLRPNVKVTVGHISLDFSAEDADRVDDDLMRQVAQEYMQRMGIQDTQYILVRHFDREHPHCHLVFNRVNSQGQVISDKNDRVRSAKVCRELTEKYGLHIAKGKDNVKRERLKGPDATKYRIYDAMMKVLPDCKSWTELEANLKKEGIRMSYTYRGHSSDIQGIVFEMNGYRFKGSKVDRAFSYSKIDTILRENARQESWNRYSGQGFTDRKPSHTFASDGKGRTVSANVSSPPSRGQGVVEAVASSGSSAASVAGSVASSIASGIGRVMSAPITTSSSPSAGGGGNSTPDDLADDEYIDEYGMRRKKRRGMHR